MSSQALIDSMTQRVAEQRAEIIAEAEAQADRIKASARDAAAHRREQTLRETERDLEQLRVRWEQMAEAEAAKAELAMKHDAVEAVLEDVRGRIEALRESAEFESILGALLEELMGAADGDVVVVAPSAHVDFVRSWLGEHGHNKVPVEPSDKLTDGVALQDPDRTYRISNTLSSRYALVLEEARKICMTSLFEG